MYINCSKCPSQAFPVCTDRVLELGMGLVEYRCISGHKTYIESEEKDGSERGNVDQRSSESSC
jgi:hypothetical protein